MSNPYDDDYDDDDEFYDDPYEGYDFDYDYEDFPEGPGYDDFEDDFYGGY